MCQHTLCPVSSSSRLSIEGQMQVPHSGASVRPAVGSGATPNMSAPLPRVAIIGGGISGLVCGNRLKQLGLDCVVFDTGKHAPGGRTSTRKVSIGGHPYLFDHSTQAITATHPRFQAMVANFVGQGVLAPWDRQVVGSLRAGGSFTPQSANTPQMYVGAQKGIASLVQHLAEPLAVQQDVWVGRLQRTAGGQWDVEGNRRRSAGIFDYVAIAHNGKCADRLMGSVGVPAVHRLLRTKFQPASSPQQVMQLCSVWVLMVAFPQPLPVTFQGAFVEGIPELSWVANNTAKIAANRRAGDSLECWTIVSSREFGSSHKVPQENIPPAKDAEVKALLLDAFARATGLTPATLQPAFARAQLWGAAVPLNVTDAACVFDAESRVGVCGDWLVSPSVEGAALSGISLAEQMASHHSGNGQGGSVGLNARFSMTSSPAIGSFGDSASSQTHSAAGSGSSTSSSVSSSGDRANSGASHASRSTTGTAGTSRIGRGPWTTSAELEQGRPHGRNGTYQVGEGPTAGNSSSGGGHGHSVAGAGAWNRTNRTTNKAADRQLQSSDGLAGLVVAEGSGAIGTVPSPVGSKPAGMAVAGRPAVDSGSQLIPPPRRRVPAAR